MRKDKLIWKQGLLWKHPEINNTLYIQYWVVNMFSIICLILIGIIIFGGK